MSSKRKRIRTIVLRLFCMSSMDDPTQPKRNRAERRAQKQQAKKSETKDVNDGNDDVFEDCQQPPPPQQQQSKNLPELNPSTEIPTATAATTTTNMSSVPNRPVSIAASVTSTASNKIPPNANKNQQVKQNKASASSEKLSMDTISTGDASEINERSASTTAKQNPTGPPINIPPKRQLTKAERRDIQEAQRAAKAQKQSPGATNAKSNETQQAAAAHPKKSTSDHPPIPSITAVLSSHLRPQSEAGDSVMSGTSRSARPATIASNAPTTTTAPLSQSQQKKQQKKANDERVTLFAHLSVYTRHLERIPMTVDPKAVHPAIVKLGLQYATRQIAGSNLRCIAFLIAIQKVLEDYEGPLGSTSLSTLDPVDLNTKLKMNINFLTKCRPNAVTMGTAIRYLKTHIERIPRNITNAQAKELLDDVIRNFLREKIEFSSKAIAETYAITKITNGDVILIFGYSSLIMRILETAIHRGIDFRVIIVDSHPQQYGLKSAQRLLGLHVKCTYVLINAVPFIISEVTKVLLGAHGLLGNGYVMSQVGTAQISLIAKTHNVPVLVCCETYKFCERVQTDSFVFNELGDPDDLIKDRPLLKSALAPSTTDTPNPSSTNLNILNMTYDVTPPTFISAVITELGILPCTSVAVVIRMQNKQLDEICGQDEQSMATTTGTTSNMNTHSSTLETVQ